MIEYVYDCKKTYDFEKTGSFFAKTPRKLLSQLHKAQLLFYLGNGAAGDVGCLLCALLHLRFKCRLVSKYLVKSCLNGSESVSASFTYGFLEFTVADTLEFFFYILKRFVRKDAVYGHEVVDTVLALGEADAGIAVGDGALELADDGVAVVQDVDHGVGVLVGLAHLLGGVGQGHDLRAALGHDGLGDGEGVGVELVEAGGDIAAQLHVLLLVDADRHYVGLVEQDVGGHELGVGEKPRVDILRIFCTFILKLCHAGKLAVHRVAIEDPAELCMRGHVRLHEEGVLRLVEAASHIERESLVGSSAKLCGHLSYGYRVKVNYAVEGLVILGEMREILDRSEIVSYSEVSRGLNARENYLFIA